MLLYGCVTGVLFGFLMQRSRIVRYDRQLGALLLRDMTVVKFVLSHMVTVMIGVAVLYDFQLVSVVLKPVVISGVVLLGGFIFGIGWGLLGYTPGTSLGALGEGRLDALWGFAGMLAGAWIYAGMYPYTAKFLLFCRQYAVFRIPEILIRVPYWGIVLSFIGFVLVLFCWFEKKGL